MSVLSILDCRQYGLLTALWDIMGDDSSPFPMISHRYIMSLKISVWFCCVLSSSCCITSYMELCDPFTHLILGGIIVPARRSWKISIMSQSNKQNVQNKTKRVNNFNERLGAFALTHLGRLTHICIGNLPIISSDNGLSPLAPNHYMNQCWNSVNWAFTNKLQ